MNFRKTVPHVEIPRFMGPWYVLAGRTTFIEKGAYNSLETYTWNAEKERIDIDFTFRKDSFTGEKKSYPQKAWIEDKTTGAYWKVQPFWPLKFDYLVIALSPDYEWTAIGVPNGKYLWIMARTPKLPAERMADIIRELNRIGYPTDGIESVPQNGS